MTDAGPIGAVALVVRFLLELAMLAALGFGGLQVGGGGALGATLAIAAVVLTATIWGLWIAPRAQRRLAIPPRIALEILLFSLATAAMVAFGQHALGITLAAIYVVDAIVVYGLAAEPVPPR